MNNIPLYLFPHIFFHFFIDSRFEVYTNTTLTINNGYTTLNKGWIYAMPLSCCWAQAEKTDRKIEYSIFLDDFCPK